MMQPAQYRATIDVPCPLDSARYWRILLQGYMRTHLVVVFHVRQQHMPKMLLAEHNNVVKALPSDRANKSFSKIRFAMGNVATPVDPEYPLIEAGG